MAGCENVAKFCTTYALLFRDEGDDMTLHMALGYEVQEYVCAVKAELGRIPNERIYNVGSARQQALFLEVRWWTLFLISIQCYLQCFTS